MKQVYLNPTSIHDALSAISNNRGNLKIIAGATDLLLEMDHGFYKNIEILVDISRLAELDYINLDPDGIIHIGSGTTHNQIAASRTINNLALPLAQACWQVGSPQIRNRATVGGNIITGSPANDTITPLMALDANLVLISENGSRTINIRDFYLGVRKSVILPNELLKEIYFNSLSDNHTSVYLKLGLRKAMAISLVNICAILRFQSNIITTARIAFGCVAPTVVNAEEMENFLIGKILSRDLISATVEKVENIISPISDLRSSAKYRYQMAGILTKHALEEILGEHKYSINIPDHPVLLSNNIGRCNHQNNEFSSKNGENPSLLINNKKVEFINKFEKKLLSIIREEGKLTGTKEGCGEGECGACTVIMDGAAVLSCLIPAGRANGASVETIESIGSKGELSLLQEAFIDKGAVQCGYCTPGFIISATKLLEEKEKPTLDEIKTAISGNLCRCTGYYKIIEAIESAIEKRDKNG